MQFAIPNRLFVATLFTLVATSGAAHAQCTGDCNADGNVTVDEIITGVNIALGTTAISVCLAFDASADGQVTVDEILTGVNNALVGCPASVCGDGAVDFEMGETCDDGNTEDGDACPANCRIEECNATGSTVLADVALNVPSGTDVAAVTLFIRYPDGTVRIPGSGNDAQVQGRLLNLPSGLSVTPNDLDYALRLVAFSPDIAPIAPGAFVTLELDTCAGATLPNRFDFECIVEDAADTGFNPVSGVTCAVTDVASTVPVCGDGVVDFDIGETCDDGNAEDGDACPANCRIAACAPSGDTVIVNVDFAAPVGAEIAALTTYLRYPDGVVRIPGAGNDTAVQSSLTPIVDGLSATPNDLDYALRYLVFSPDFTAIPAGGLVSIEFDTCVDAPAVTIEDFTCIVEDAADTSFESVDGVTCSASF